MLVLEIYTEIPYITRRKDTETSYSNIQGAPPMVGLLFSKHPTNSKETSFYGHHSNALYVADAVF